MTPRRAARTAPVVSSGWLQHAWVGGVVLIACLVAADVLLERHMSGTYAGGAVLAAILSSSRRTSQVAAVAIVAAAASGTWNDNLGSAEWLARLVVCSLMCAVAVGMAAVADRRRSDLEHTTALAQRVLDALAVELTGARTTKEVAEGFVGHAVRTLGAHSAMVMTLDPDDVLRSVVWEGGGEQANHYQELPLSSDVPGAVATRTRTDLHLRSRKQIEQAFPDLVGYYPEDRSLHVLPLHRDDKTLGALAMSFPRSAIVAREEGFLHSLASSLTSALLRADALQVADAAAQRTALLSEASLTLSRHLEVDAVLDEVGRLLVPRFADWCSVQLLEDGDALRTVFVQHRDPQTTQEARRSIQVFPTRMDRDFGAPQVVRTGSTELYTFIPSDVVDAAAVNEQHRQVLRRLGFTSALIVPLRGRAGILGALTLIHADSGRRYAEADVAFVEQVADRIALALDTATTFTRQSARLADVSQVAEAVQRAILAPPPARAGSVRLSARYRSAAREAQVGGDLYEVVTRSSSVRLLIGDVRGKGLDAVRTATIVLGEFRAAAAGDADLATVAREIDRRLGPYLPDPEDFVTAALVEIHHDGSYSAISCGHPAPVVLSHAGGVHSLDLVHEPPLGLGVRPRPTGGVLEPGDRLLLFTDGLIEARRPGGAFVDPVPLLETVTASRHETVLDDLLEQLRVLTGDGLDDDLALVLACYEPAPLLDVPALDSPVRAHAPAPALAPDPAGDPD